MEKAVTAGNPDLLRRCTDDFDTLWFRVAMRQPAYHVGRFNNLAGRVQSMRDPAQAEKLLTQGRRAINNNDIEGLKAVNSQLFSLLPSGEQAQADKRISDLI